MKKITLIAALAAATMTTAATAQSFMEAYEQNRARYGAGHTFEWEGKQYSTDREEDQLVAQPATKENAQALIDAAKAKHEEAREVGFPWRDTMKRIGEAEAALAAGEFQKAMDIAGRAHYQARMGVAQSEYAKDHWILAVPPLN